MRRKLHRHDLSKEHDFSCNMGDLIPAHWRFVYPNDRVRQRSDFLVRVSPLLAPIYSKAMIKVESFYVAADTIWTGAQEFFSGGQDGMSTKVIPTKTQSPPSGIGQGTLADFLGFRAATLTTTFNILPFRVYDAICNWHYFDQDLDTPLTISLADGPDTTTSVALQKRRWERDRFTTSRLEPQRGDDVLIPMSETTFDVTGQAPVTGIGKANQTFPDGAQNVYETGDSGTSAYAGSSKVGDALTNNVFYVENDPNNAGYPNIRADADHTGADMEVDIAPSAGTIRELEERVAINRFRLRLQQADGSYPDYCLATFGIRAPDIELQKPVLLARSATPLQISEVLQTAQQYDSADQPIGAPVGDYVGHGIAVARSHGFKYRIKRHGFIMTMFSVVPNSMYILGNDKEWFRSTKEDYFDPDLDQIGEEPIFNKEVQATHADQDEIFGYQYRNYCDRSSLHQISGEFRNELAFFTQAREFGSDPALNATFVTCDPSDRIFALGSTVDQLRVKSMHDVKMLRVMRRIPNRGIL